jgi:hypothetical protein
MRTTLSRSLVLALAFLALIGSVIHSHAQDVVLVGMTNTLWKYYQSTNEPLPISNINWKATNYNDSTWTSGPGVFGFEDSTAMPPGAAIRTPLNLTQPNATAQTLSYYFRTAFNWSGATLGAELTFTNIIDDGAVVYLNGTELYRYRITGTPTYSTLAAGGTEGIFEYNFITNSSLLRPGNNVLAVEVHQSSTNSSDIVFGLGLRGRAAIAPTITAQPQGDNATVGDRVEFIVTANGTGLAYQWFKDNVAIAGQRASNYVIAAAQASSAGTYHVVVSNIVGSVRSSNAVLTVTADVFPPEIVNAWINQTDPTRVFVTLNETPLRIPPADYASHSAINVANYRIQCASGNSFTNIEIRAALASGPNLRLDTTNAIFSITNEYYLTVEGLMDSKTNIMGKVQWPISFVWTTNLVDFHNSWKYNYAFQSSPPTNWIQSGYQEDGTWAEGSAPLFFTSDLETNCFGIFGQGFGNGTELTIGYPTYVFRTKFIVPTNVPNSGLLAFNYILDDGAIFYRNGKEILRVNLPEGPVTYDTLAPAQLEASQCRSNSFAFTDLRGTNTLAVEVHQSTETTGMDIAFGLEVLGYFTNTPAFPPVLNFQKTNSPNRLILSWQGTGYRLLSSTNASTNGPWSAVTGVITTGGVTNRYTNSSITGPKQFYRLQRP